MGIFSFITGGEAVDMARKASAEPNKDVVADAVARLRAASLDGVAFSSALSSIESHPAADVTAIAAEYAPVGTRATTKKAALAKIKKRFVELVRQQAKNKAAAKITPW